MVDKHKYYIEHRDEILERYKGQYHKTKNELEDENTILYNRIKNLQIIIKGKDQYIEDLRKMINDLKKEKSTGN